MKEAPIILSEQEKKKLLVDELLELVNELSILLDKLNQERGSFRFDENPEVKSWRTAVASFIDPIQRDLFSNFERLQKGCNWKGNIDRGKLIPWRSEEVDIAENFLEQYIDTAKLYKETAKNLQLSLSAPTRRSN
ncbi:MAG: hypothetical protein WCT37_03420 [Patescibacteria group bacterium]|jgi:hypothetical protein